MIRWYCRYCDGEVRAESRHAGRNVDCPHCKALVRAPDPDRRGRSRGFERPAGGSGASGTVVVIVALACLGAGAVIGFAVGRAAGPGGGVADVFEGTPHDTHELHTRLYGKSAEDVVRVLGKPAQITPREGGAMYHYPDSYKDVHVIICLRGGIVTDIMTLPKDK